MEFFNSYHEFIKLKKLPRFVRYSQISGNVLMASYDPNSLTEDELCCPVCFEEYEVNKDSERLPKLLMCMHTFCVACINNICNMINTVICPLCRNKHEDVSLANLFDNYAILNFLKKQQIEKDSEMARMMDDEGTNEGTDEDELEEDELDEDEGTNEGTDEDELEDTIFISSDEYSDEY